MVNTYPAGLGRTNARRRRSNASARLLVIAGLVGFVFEPGVALAAIEVYADAPGSTLSLPVGASSVAVFISAGSTASSSGTPCIDGNGDELCGWSVRLEGTGGVALTGFTPGDPGKTPAAGVSFNAHTLTWS